MTRHTISALILVWAVSSTRPGHAADLPLIYAVVVGHNDGLGLLPQLHYADDDALRFYRLATQLAPEKNVALLTELDVDTWRRIQYSGQRPPPYLPPTKAKLLEVINLYKRQIAKIRLTSPEQPVHFFFFFSGHGERGYFLLKRSGQQAVDSAFTGGDLRRTFADSKATLNTLFIDACKSQSLFIEKGQGAQDKELGPDFSGLINKLDRAADAAPIGVLTSTVSDKPAGEARDIMGGYFSHVLTSGLSGAADANSDGVVRYGELAAFVSFNTRRISGQRPWFRPPRGSLQTPLVFLKRRANLLEILPGIEGHFAVFDDRGQQLLLEVNKTAAQWTRLILPPGKYQVVWVKPMEQGLMAQVDTHQGSQQLMLQSFSTPIMLGQDQVPKGEGLGAPPEAEDLTDLALRRFNVNSSGFDQPFTPRVVSALADAYHAGVSSAPSALPSRQARDGRQHHLVSLGYGYFSPPADPLTGGQGITLGYAYRFGLPLQVGGHAIFGFSDHPAADSSSQASFRMKRLMLQVDARYVIPLGGRFEISAGPYLGWQVVMLSRDEMVVIPDDVNKGDQEQRQATVLYGDEGSFRAGLISSLRMELYRGLYLAGTFAWGVELLKEQDDAGSSLTSAFWRPQFFGQVGYGF